MRAILYCNHLLNVNINPETCSLEEYLTFGATIAEIAGTSRSFSLPWDGVESLDASEMVALAMRYKDGISVKRDERKALELMECAAHLNIPDAMRKLV